MNKLEKFSTRLLNVWVIVISTIISALSVQSVSPDSLHVSRLRQDHILANSTLSNLEKRMLRMGLKKSHNVRYSRASWYGGYFHGRTTANMEIFDKNLLTCAHKTLPLNTYLLVTNLNNKRKVILRVNDRGPYVDGREIDLSEAAARQLGSHSKGVVPIRYEILVNAA